MTDFGLKFIRRQVAEGKYYFIVNLTGKDIDTTVAVNAPGACYMMNPLNGVAGRRTIYTINGVNHVRLQLKSGESVLLKMTDKRETAPEWQYRNVSGKAVSLKNNTWTLQFKDGGPAKPGSKKMKGLQPWTSFTSDTATQSFSGTGVYSTSFVIKNKAADYLLELDKLHESARIIVNGKDAGLIWSLPYELKIGQFLKEGNNTISIEVANLMANRMRNMDRNKITWRNYHEINFVNINYKGFDAAGWPVQVSGLGGDVRLVPLRLSGFLKSSP
jgi:hypothetical protein